jgi:uncharacterized protein (DUF2062 family)
MDAASLLKARIVDPIVQQLTRGLSPERVAMTIAVGLLLAIIPVIGVTTILCFLAAWALGLNQPIIQLINWSSAALQILLIIPFIRLGEAIFRAPRMTRSLEELVAMARSDPVVTMAMLGETLGHAVVAWLVVSPLLIVSVYFGSRPLLRRLARRAASARRGDIHDVA